MQTTKFTRSLRALVMAGAVCAVTAGALATPALADSDDWHGGHGGWGDRDHDSWHGRGGWYGDRDDWRRGPAYGYSYGYAYPYTYYAPPAPVYAAPPSVGVYFGIR